MKTIKVRRNNIELRVLVAGDASQPTLLLVHGFPLDHRMWSSIVPLLSSEYHIIAPDLRGFGQSELGDDDITLKAHAHDLHAILEAIGPTQPIFLVGLSMGGYIAWEFWSAFCSQLSGMILCDTRAAADSDEVAANRKKIASSVRHEGTWHVVEPMLVKLLCNNTRSSKPDVVHLVRSMMMSTKESSIAAAQLAMADRLDFTSRLGEINCPVLCLVGEDDELTPLTEMEQLSQTLPIGRLSVVEHSGHLPPLENPETTASAIKQFISAVLTDS